MRAIRGAVSALQGYEAPTHTGLGRVWLRGEGRQHGARPRTTSDTPPDARMSDPRAAASASAAKLEGAGTAEAAGVAADHSRAWDRRMAPCED